mmetsp:Transcript_81933/g.237607  ORF Transcript_81933/g.237607 Transcript_81933/m.237607 type:complete len:250 (-) Transcript_81933:829-1578(-)
MLRVREAATGSWRYLQDRVLRDRQLPCVLDRHAFEIGDEQLQHGQMGHKKNRPGCHLHLYQNALQTLHHIHVALSAGKAPSERVLLPLGEKHRMPLLHLLPWRDIAVAFDVPPTRSDCSLVDRIQGRRLLMIAGDVVNKGDGARHRAGNDVRGLRRLSHRRPVLRRALPDELRERERRGPPDVAELRQAVALVGALGVRLACPCADQPDRARADVHRHHERQHALRQTTITTVRHDLGRQIKDLDVCAL